MHCVSVSIFIKERILEHHKMRHKFKEQVGNIIGRGHNCVMLSLKVLTQLSTMNRTASSMKGHFEQYLFFLWYALLARVSFLGHLNSVVHTNQLGLSLSLVSQTQLALRIHTKVATFGWICAHGI